VRFALHLGKAAYPTWATAFVADSLWRIAMFFPITCSFLVTLSLLAAEKPADPPVKKELAELQGTWKLVSVEINGEDGDSKAQPRWIIKGDKVSYGGQELAVLKTDASATPKIIDLAFRDPKKVYEGIYAVDKDTLKICLNAKSDTLKERPAEFSTMDKEHLRLLVFKRDKAKETDAMAGVNGYVGIAIKQEKDPDTIVIGATVDGSPAKKGGLLKDDVILKIGGVEVTDLRSTVEMVRQVKPGRDVAFLVRRDGKEKEITIKAGVLPFKWLTQLD
jgi:uncharacterized protein (TIGR03067 family)